MSKDTLLRESSWESEEEIHKDGSDKRDARQKITAKIAKGR